MRLQEMASHLVMSLLVVVEKEKATGVTGGLILR